MNRWPCVAAQPGKGGVCPDATKRGVLDHAGPPPGAGAPPVLAPTAAVGFARPPRKGVCGDTPRV